MSDGSVHGHRVTVARLDMDQGLCIGAVYDQQLLQLQRDFPGKISARAVNGTLVFNATGLQLRLLMRDRGIATKRETKLQSRREVSGRDRPEDGSVAAGSHMRCTALVGGCSSELEQLQQRLDVRIGATGGVAPVLIEANMMLYNSIVRTYRHTNL